MERVLVIGGGLIGCGWAAAFAGAGHEVAVLDPDPAAADRLERTWQAAQPVLAELGRLVEDAPAPSAVSDPAELPWAPDFVQEALPERLDLKRQVLRGIEPHLRPGTVVASSSSGLAPAEIADGLAHPERVIIGHPCNPPYVMQVVETCGQGPRSEDALARAEELYRTIGKTVLRLKKPMPGHLVNRLQAAIFREAVFLAREGIAELGDIERAVTEGLAPRWTQVGPATVFHLSGAAGGMARFLDALGPEMERWWASLGAPVLDEETRNALIEGMQRADPRPVSDIAAERDRKLPKLIAYLQTHNDHGTKCHEGGTTT